MASILSKKQKKREKYTLSDLKTLGNQLLSSRAHVNNLPLLLTFVSPSSPPHHVLETILSLQSFFTIDLPSKSSTLSKTDPEFIYRTWLRSKFDDFVNSLINLLTSLQCEEPLKEVVLDTIMELVKLGNSGRFNSAVYHRFIHGIVFSTSSASFLLDLLESKYFKYLDVRYFTYISLRKITKILESKDIPDIRTTSADEGSESHSNTGVDLSIRMIHHILAHIPPVEVLEEKSYYETWIGSGFSSKESDRKDHSELPDAKDKQCMKVKNNNNVSPVKMAKKMKLKFTKAWISFLRLPLPLDVYKEVLVNLHQAVIPHLSNPIMLCDFLTRSYDIGGVVSVMALSSLFVLMTQHGLEYPNFYEKLYALLLPSIFIAKHRAKFFQLLDSCMKSNLLPAYLAAAFAKKLSRLALSVPPCGALVIIALIHNLLRRHPSINCLVHRENDDGTARDDSIASEHGHEGVDLGSLANLSSRQPGIDHFNEEFDPAKSNAMRSSLWEVDTLRHHYCPPVSRFVLSLETDLTVRAKTTEVAVDDFSGGSYATIFMEEMGRRVKQVPVSFYKVTPTALFSESEFVGWTFNGNEIERQGEEVGKAKSEEEEEEEEDNGHNSAKRQRSK